MAAQGPGVQGWCGAASPAVERALTAIFAQDGAETPGADAPHCPVCALAKAAALAAPLAVPVPQDRPAALTFTAPAAKTAPPPATGPPLGGRAPPFA